MKAYIIITSNLGTKDREKSEKLSADDNRILMND